MPTHLQESCPFLSGQFSDQLPFLSQPLLIRRMPLPIVVAFSGVVDDRVKFGREIRQTPLREVFQIVPVTVEEPEIYSITTIFGCVKRNGFASSVFAPGLTARVISTRYGAPMNPPA